MKIGILGTGSVARTLGGKLAELGHEVMLGTRDVAATLGRSEPNAHGLPPFGVWHAQNPRVKLGTFADAARHGENLINATNGMASLDALGLAGEASLNHKILIDVSNPLDFSHGMPPTLSVCNTDSLGEQIQRAYPGARVVKTLNTITASLMIDPASVAGADHTLFVCGNDGTAKTEVTTWLKDWFGWQDVLDLGDITNARAVEMYLPLWLRLWRTLGSSVLNIKIVK